MTFPEQVYVDKQFEDLRDIAAKTAKRLGSNNKLSEERKVLVKPDFAQKQKNLFDTPEGSFVSQKKLELAKSFKPSLPRVKAILASANMSSTNAENMPSSISVLNMHCEHNAKKPEDCGYQTWPYVQQAIRRQALMPFSERLRPCVEHRGWVAFPSCQKCKLAIWELLINGKIFMGKRQGSFKKSQCEIFVPLTGEIVYLISLEDLSIQGEESKRKSPYACILN